MGGVSGGQLAAAVSAAGALGMIGFTGGPVEEMQGQAAIAAAGGRPFGVGLLAWTFRAGDEAYVDAALEGGAALGSGSYRDYAPLVGRGHPGGGVFATQAGTVADARAAVDAGADVVVARGSEGGGHGPASWPPCRCCRRCSTR